jgi:hypothetical protein
MRLDRDDATANEQRAREIAEERSLYDQGHAYRALLRARRDSRRDAS